MTTIYFSSENLKYFHISAIFLLSPSFLQKKEKEEARTSLNIILLAKLGLNILIKILVQCMKNWIWWSNFSTPSLELKGAFSPV